MNATVTAHIGPFQGGRAISRATELAIRVQDQDCQAELRAMHTQKQRNIPWHPMLKYLQGIVDDCKQASRQVKVMALTDEHHEKYI